MKVLREDTGQNSMTCVWQWCFVLFFGMTEKIPVTKAKMKKCNHINLKTFLNIKQLTQSKSNLWNEKEYV